jgi:hypothetical protein
MALYHCSLMWLEANSCKPASRGLPSSLVQHRGTLVEQYFAISHLHGRAKRAKFTTIIKNQFDGWFRQAAFNVARGMKIILRATI